MKSNTSFLRNTWRANEGIEATGIKPLVFFIPASVDRSPHAQRYIKRRDELEYR